MYFRIPLLPATCVDLCHTQLHLHGTRHGPLGIIVSQDRGPEDDKDGIANKLIYGTLMFQYDFGHGLEIDINNTYHIFGRESFTDSRKAAKVCHHDRYEPFLPSKDRTFRCLKNRIHDVIGEILAEGLANDLVCLFEFGLGFVSFQEVDIAL